MNAEEFQQYLSTAIENYASEHVEAGDWEKSGAISKARNEYEKLLPMDEKTDNHYLYSIYTQDKVVGMIWFSKISNDKGFIYDINILNKFQGKGYGKEAMKLIEIEGKKFGIKKIRLHVFGHNQTAFKLYEKIGYQTTNVMMEKNIEDNDWENGLTIKELHTLPKKKSFKYQGSLAGGLTLYFGTSRKEKVSQQQCRHLLEKFKGDTILVGRSFNNPPPGSLGEWLIENVTKRAIASYVAPILVEEGYAKWISYKELQFF